MKKKVLVFILLCSLLVPINKVVAATIYTTTATKDTVNVNLVGTYNYSTFKKDAYAFEKYGKLVDTYSLGTSADGRELIAISVGTGKKKVIVTGGIHAREAQINTPILMKNIENLVETYYGLSTIYNQKTTRNLLESVTFIIVPLVNPDGNEVVLYGGEAIKNKNLWASRLSKKEGAQLKSNAKGVDLNRNYSYKAPSGYLVTNKPYACDGVVSTGPSLCGYSGVLDKEFETIALQKLVQSNIKDLRFVLDVHSRGGYSYIMNGVYMANPNSIYANTSKSDYLKINESFAALIKQRTNYYLYYPPVTNDPSFIGGTFQKYVVNQGIPTLTLETISIKVTFPLSKPVILMEYSRLKNILLIIGEKAKQY